MGLGFFPTVLGWVLAGLGAIIVLFSFRRTVYTFEPPPFALRTLVPSRGDFGIFIERLITAVALGICVLMLVGSIWSYSRRRAKADADAQLVAANA